MKELKRIKKVEKALREAIERALEEGVTLEGGCLGVLGQRGRWAASDDVAPVVCAIGALLYGRPVRRDLVSAGWQDSCAAALLGISIRQVYAIEMGFDDKVISGNEYYSLGGRLRRDYCLPSEETA